MSIEEFETEVSNIVDCEFAVIYKSQYKNKRATVIADNGLKQEFSAKGVKWEEAFSHLLDTLKLQYVKNILE